MALHIVVLVLNVINFLLHSFGSYVLTKIVLRPDSRPQYILLLCLSCTESAMNLLKVISDVPNFISRSKLSEGSEKAYSIVSMICLTGTWLFLYYVMHLIVIDRLLAALLMLRYSTKVTKKRTLIAALIGAFLAILLTILTILAHEYLQFDWRGVYFTYIYNVLHASFVTLSVASYSYIFYKFQQSKRQLNTSFRSKRAQERHKTQK